MASRFPLQPIGWLSSALFLGMQPLPLLAQSPPAASPLFASPPPPSNLGEPGGRSEAASRGCSLQETDPSTQEEGLTALVPVVAADAFDAVWGVTTLERPTFWFDISRSIAPGTAEFILEDGTNQWTYPVSLANLSGIVQISLPESSPPLVPGVDYHWYFNVYCQPEQPPFFVHGWIRRVELEPDLAAALAQADPAQQVELYGASGIWYDALAIAAHLRATRPNHPAWSRLLESADLESLADRPLVNCCRVEPD
ncbi:MAG: DUF928 domain-containing protein [Synechococcales bacterium]|nr:DUF928 domain-containing protein [Synechococcales bacterium]